MKRKRHNPEQIIRKLRSAVNCSTKAKQLPMYVELWRHLLPPTTVDSNSPAACRRSRP
jgi:hypothetical protein